MSKRWIIAVIITVAACSGVWAGGVPEEMTPETVSGGFKRIVIGDSRVLWRVEEENLSLRFSAPTTGWVAVGFNPSQYMKDANIIIGYVENGQVRVSDQFGDSSFTHRPDTSLGGTNDILSSSGSEADGSTTIEVTIPLDSGDRYDRPLAEGETVTMILAYGRNGTDNFEIKHATRVSVEVPF